MNALTEREIRSDATPYAPRLVRLLMAGLLALAAILGPTPSAWGLAGQTRAFSASENQVLTAYVAYYGRPGDVAGLRYWSQRMDAEGGDLTAIIQAFGVSQEFDERYGQLPPPDLVNGLYRQLFARDAEPGGLAFYVDLLERNVATLQTIALDIIFGAINQDAVTVAHRLEVTRYYVTRVELVGAPAPDLPADQLAALIQPVTDDPATRDAGLVAVDLLIADIPRYARVFAVTKTDDTADGACNADCSLREAVIAANASPGLDLISVPAGHYRLVLNGPSEESDQYRDLEIRDNLHIDGAGTDLTTLDGNGWTRVVQVDTFGSGVSARISDLTITGGAHPFGGGLLNSGTLVLRDVALRDNVGHNGGGILNTGNLLLDRSTLERNKALPEQPATGFGGAIWNATQGSVTIVDSALRTNNAHFNGGAIYSQGTLGIVRSVFAENIATIGGAIDSVGALAVSNSTLSAKLANDGGGIAIQAGTAVLSDSEFRNNQATGTDLGGGGALFNYQADLEVRGCRFEGNGALGEGGGAIETNGPLLVRDSVFTGNQAFYHTGHSLPADTSPGFGGAILIIAGSQVTMEDSQITSNRAGVSGGGIYNDRSTNLTLARVLIDGNVAERNYGGGINNEGDITLDAVTISNNQSAVHGGGMTTNLGTVIARDSEVFGNRSKTAGGIGNFLGGRVRLERCTVATNTAEGDGTQATGFGGGILNDVGQTEIVASLVRANQAQFGGGLSVNNAAGLVLIEGSTFELNSAPDGSALVNFGTVKVSGSRISGTCNNHASLQDLGGNSVLCR